jgi:hypothetical protein
MNTPIFTKLSLLTDADGLARWHETPIPLTEGSEAARLSNLASSQGYQLRQSPPGFRSQWHCTVTPQWVFILSGQMVIGLRDGSERVLSAGQHFYSADIVPSGAEFDPKIHGHWSAQGGMEPLVTLFLRA